MHKFKRRCLIATILATIGCVLFFIVTTKMLVIPMIKEIKTLSDLCKTFDLFPQLPYWGVFALCLICDIIFFRLANMLYVIYRQIYSPLIEYNNFILALAENKIPNQLKLDNSKISILTPLGKALNLVRDRIIITHNRLRKSQEREEYILKSSETAKYLKSIIIGRLTPDIRQPLQSIKGFDEILRTKSDRKKLLQDEARIYSAGIQRNIEAISALIAQIVKFIEIDTNSYSDGISAVKTTDLLNEVIKINQVPFKERSVSINTIFSTSMPEKLIINEDFFVQALLIITRAVFRASEHGENLYIYADSDAENIYIRVRDSKKLPCRENLSAEFNNFDQDHAVFDDYNNLSTTVLGLFFIESELAKLNGKLKVESNQYAHNEVSIVFKKIDILSSALDPAASHFKSGEIYTPQNNFSQIAEQKVSDDRAYTVLLAEDNQDNAFVMSEVLKLYDFQVVAQNNSDEILKSVKTQSFDGIILSNSMRHKHLLHLIEEIRTADNGKNIPIAVVASKINQQKKKELKQLGVSFIMLKPINFIDFINKLKHFIYYSKLNNL